ncbi:tyrosine--tRNA ligase [Candidatus Woesearchaeota archaeon]|nr:tyrosine--tRNA ligase [Candidatus Woesearchaeota archaeon]MBW3017679.1 tyrosine--tRNA ligase [Candidatus Woesearchaeota archaeon]
MDSETKFDLITRNTEEVLTPEDLRNFIETGVPLKHYIGFEISGKVHLGTGLMTGLKVADFQKAGVDCSIFLATWHAWINNKLGGDIEVIRRAAVYFGEALKISLKVMGGDPEKLKMVSGDELYHNNDEYWLGVVEIAKNMTLNRAIRGVTIMGRKEGEAMPLAFLFYPPMQVADIFNQGLTLAHAGMDQRKAHVIAREVGLKLKVNPLMYKNKQLKPVAIHHPLIMGLQKPPMYPVPKDKIKDMLSELKMSKSVGGSSVFIHDTEEEIREKLNKAFCPEKDIDFNPIINWVENLVFTRDRATFLVERPEKFGGNIEYDSLVKLKNDFAKGELHPLDLKKATAEYLVKLLEPARKHFEKPKLKKLKEEIDNIKLTR